MQRVDLVGLDAVLLDGLGHLGGGQLAVLGQGLERGHDDVVAVHLEVLAQLAAEVAAAEAVGAQHLVRPALGHERTDLLGIRLHVVGGSDHRAFGLAELLLHERRARGFRGMQQVPALGLLAVARQLVEARAAPHGCGHAPVLLQQFLGDERFAQDRAAAQQLHGGRALLEGRRLFAEVHALDDLLFRTRLQAGHGVVLVEQRQVVEDVFLALDHALQAVVHDDGDLVREGRVVADAVRNRVGQDVAVAVLVLQAFAVQRGAARCAAQQEASRLHVAGRPGQVADALEAEHRVIHVERDHDPVVRAVRRGRGDPAGHAAGLVDALLQDLAGLVLAVVHHLVLVHRGVLLAVRVVDADLAEQAFHAEGAGFVHQDGHHARADGLVAQQLREEAHVGLRGRDLAAFGRGIEHGLEDLQRRHGEALVGLRAAVRQVAAEGLAALVQVLHFRGVVGRLVERQVGDLAVGNRDVEAVAEGLDVLVAELLGLVYGVLALADLAHAEALDGLHQQHRGLTLVLVGGLEGRIDLLRIVAAAAQVPDLVVAHVLDHLERAGIAAEEVLAHVGAVIGLERLVVPVVALHHDLAQRAVLVAGQQVVPALAPQKFDDVPAGAAEFAFQLLDDLAVAAHRAIQALQVAVDDEDQVVEVLARGQADGAQGLHLIHLAVAAEHPDLAVLCVGDATGLQVLQETGLVDGHQRAQAHRDRGELPELGHQLGVRIAGQALAVHFLAEVQQLLLGEAAFQVGACVDAGRHVALDVQQVAAVALALGVPEMVEARAEHVGQRGEGADVAAQVAAFGWVVAVGLDHHRHGVPAHVGAQAGFDLEVAGAARLLAGLDRVHVAGVGGERHVDAALARMFEQLLEQEVGPLSAFAVDHGRQCVHPLAGFLLVGVGGGRRGFSGLRVGLSSHACLLYESLALGVNPRKFRILFLNFEWRRIKP